MHPMRTNPLRSVSVIISFATFFSCVPAIAADASILSVQVLPQPSGSIAVGSQRVKMLSVRLTASCGSDVTLVSIALHHRGLGNPQDIERVYAFAEDSRLTRSALMSGKNGVATLQFKRLKIHTCETQTIDVLADFRSDAAAAGEHQLMIAGEGDVWTDPAVHINLNPTGTAVTIPVGKPVGAVSAEGLTLPLPLTYGNARTVARLRLRGDANDDQQITAITFVNDGTARDADLQNLFLETSGHTRLSPTIPTLNGDRVRLELSPPLLIHRNEVRLIQLLGDIRASRRKTVELRIQEPADIEVDSLR